MGVFVDLNVSQPLCVYSEPKTQGSKSKHNFII